MAVDPLSTWKSTLKAIPTVANTSWALTFAQWYAARIAAIAPAPAGLVASGFLFPFHVPTFASALQALMPTGSALTGITGFANAWASAMQTTVPVCAPGTFKPPTSPATLFSVVTTTVLDPAGIAAGKAKLLELAGAAPVDDADNSQFPQVFREATLLLTITVTGLNSLPPPPGGPGPQPFTVAAAALA